MNKIKFEYVYAILLLEVLTDVLFVFRDNEKVVITIVTVLVRAISSITAFFLLGIYQRNEIFYLKGGVFLLKYTK